MHKRYRALLALGLVLALLCGCAAVQTVRSAAQPQLTLYYCRTDGLCATGTGALGTEQVAAADYTTPQALLERYLQGPQTAELALPEGLRGTSSVVDVTDGLVTVCLGGAAQTQLAQTLTAACLTLSLSQLEGIQAVQLEQIAARQTLLQGPYTTEDFVLYDTAADSPESPVTLYYPDAYGKLKKVQSVVDGTDPDQLPLLAVQALITGAVPYELVRAVPQGTQVLDISVSGETASVILSEAFMNCDTSPLRAANAARAITATLCELSGIEAVQLSIIGDSGLTHYDISQPLRPTAQWFAPN